ncbi:MAG: hypothetical protein U0229_02620 [Anaeromyxobacter sp.]
MDELRRAHAAPAILSVRCPAAADGEGAAAQAATLARLADALRGTALARRGPLGGPQREAQVAAPVRIVEDGGAAEARAEAALPEGASDGAPGPRGETRLELAAARLDADARDRLEARAYLETHALLSRLGLAGAASRIARALERRLGSMRR